VRCAACESENPPAARFCAACGARLAVTTCPSCQADVAPGSRFCTACGEPLTPRDPTAPAPPEAPGTEPGALAERRHVSVLFVDLVDFTSLAESMDPEEVRAIQARYFDVARSIVATYGGTIEKFIGDAVMAVWGAPVAHEDDPARAVRAALTIVYAVRRMGGPATFRDLDCRAAVTTGEAAVTVGASGHGMVAGDLVNVAARLQGRAPAGAVLVDRATRDAAPGAATFSRVGSLALRGRTRRMEAYRAEDAGGDEAVRRTGAHGGDLVGRGRELAELTGLVTSVLRDGHARLVSVTGIAGIGKSRLVWELDRWVDDHPESMAWHVGRVPAYGEGIAFAALAEMVRRRARIPDDAAPELARRQLASTIRELARDEDERRWIEPRVASLLARGESGGHDRDELFAAWRRFFERVAERIPVILVFEDLHWADPSLLDFIEYVATWSRERPIFILTLSRPELLDRRPSWGAGVGSFTSIRLERLSTLEMRELLAQRAPQLPRDLVPPILERAGGVPLYAVEVARMLGDLRQSRRGSRRRSEAPPTDPASMRVPESLHGLIAARIDALPAGERRLLLAAAVLGHEFRPEALVTVAGGDPAVARERIDGLVRREILIANEEIGSPGRGELGFVQDLVREVAYGTLARTERRTLHLAAAHYLESLDDGVAEQLASHLLEAHRLTSDGRDAERLARRAVAALRRAAAGAIALHVPDRAVGLLESALAVGSADQRPVLLAESADAARAAGRLDVAESQLRELIALQVAAGATADEARSRARLASVMLSAQRNEPALVELETAMRAIRRWGADPSGVELAAQLARARSLMGDDDQAIEWADRALKAATRLGLEGIATDLLITRGTSRVALGDADGLTDLRRAIALAQEAGSLNTELRARNNEAWALLGDDPRAALDTARHGMELATSMGLGEIAINLADIACTASVETGDWSWAIDTIGALGRRGMPETFAIVLAATASIIGGLWGTPDAFAPLDALEPLPPDTDRQVLAAVSHARAWQALLGGNLESARALASEATDGFLGNDPAYQRALACRAALWAGDRDGAQAFVDSMRAMGGLGRASEATVLTLRAGLAAVDGRPDGRARYREARSAWEQLGLPLQLALCMIDEARLREADADRSELDALLYRLEAEGLRGTLTPG